jgi:hypothetical protein
VEVDGRERWERAAAREETKSAMLWTAGMRAPMLEPLSGRRLAGGFPT